MAPQCTRVTMTERRQSAAGTWLVSNVQDGATGGWFQEVFVDRSGSWERVGAFAVGDDVGRRRWDVVFRGARRTIVELPDGLPDPIAPDGLAAFSPSRDTPAALERTRLSRLLPAWASRRG